MNKWKKTCSGVTLKCATSNLFFTSPLGPKKSNKKELSDWFFLRVFCRLLGRLKITVQQENCWEYRRIATLPTRPHLSLRLSTWSPTRLTIWPQTTSRFLSECFFLVHTLSCEWTLIRMRTTSPGSAPVLIWGCWGVFSLLTRETPHDSSVRWLKWKEYRVLYTCMINISQQKQ